MTATLYELKRAIRQRDIIPHFQPIVDLRGGNLVGFETLARWTHPLLGPVNPTEFIAKSERYGLIDKLTDVVIQQAAQVASRWPSHLRLSFNISTIQLQHPELATELRSTVEAAGFSMDRMTVEITESALIGDTSVARGVVTKLKDMGCRLAIDDFGTGYSSLNHLRSLPFDVLKVDGSFVRSMTSTRENRKIVAAVVGLGHSLGLTVVAEGIEEQEQADMLLCLGCHIGQGWLYGRAQSAATTKKLLSSTPSFDTSAFPSQQIASDVAFSLQANPANRLAQLQALYDGAPVGLGFLNTDLRYVSLNQRLAEINERPVEAHIGRTVAEVIPDFTATIYPRLKEALAGKASSFHIDMGDRSLFAHYQPARDESSEVIGISVAIIDITTLRETLNTLGK